MAFAMLHGYPFEFEDFFRGRRGGGHGCHAMAMARAGAFGPSACASGRQCRPGRGSGVACSFNFGVDEETRRFEVVETPESYHVFFDASGFSRSDLSVQVTDGQLRVRAVKTEEGSSTTFERSWALPKNIFQDGISAKLGDSNELTIVLPKLPPKAKVEFQVPVEGLAGAAESQTVPEQPSSSMAAGPSNVGEDVAMGQEDVPDNQAAQGVNAETEVDGSWVDVADEDVDKAKAKGKAPMEGPVVQETAKTSYPGPSEDAE